VGLFDSVQTKSKKDQTRDEIEIMQFISNKLDQRRYSASRLGKEANWLTNIAYLLGYDQVFYDARAGAFKQINYKIPLMRANKVHSNRILPTVQNRIARMCKNPPRFEIPPNSMDQDDKDAARLSLQVAIHQWDRLKMNQRRIILKMWTEQCGYAFAKVCWDDSMGDLLDYDEANNTAIWEGDFRMDIVSPFEAYEDPGAREWCEVRDIIQCKVRHLSYFRDNYEQGDLVEEEGLWLTSLQYLQRIEDINNNTGSSTGQTLKMKDSAIEIGYYEKPSKRHPMGRHVCYANGVLLKDDVLPGHHKRKRLPFVKFDSMPIAGRFQSEAAITHMRPLQDQRNRLLTMRAAFANRTLYGKFLAAKGHGLSKTQLIDQSGEVVEYTHIPNHEGPRALNPPVLPEYALAEDHLLKGDMDDIAATSEISRGQMPSAGLPAKGMEILLEADNTRLGIQTENDEHAFADLVSLFLEFVAEYYDTERVLKDVGENMEYAVRKYKGTDLKDHLDVKCKRGSTVPGSKVMDRQEILNAFDRGLLGDPNDPVLRQKVMSWCEYGDIAEVWKPYAMKRAYIRSRIIEPIEQGLEPDTSEFDDHKLIFEELNEYRISDRYLKLSDAQKQILMNTIELHVQHIVNITSPENTDTTGIPEKSTAAEDALAQEMKKPGPMPPPPPPGAAMPQGPPGQPPPGPPGMHGPPGLPPPQAGPPQMPPVMAPH
jgi:hypothetical protein